VPVEVLGFGNKYNEICVMVIISGMIFVSIFMGQESGPCCGYESVAFLDATIHSGHDVRVFNYFIKSHTFKDPFHVERGILGRNDLAQMTVAWQGASVVGSHTEFIHVHECFRRFSIEWTTC
jgi:hypothetical protein